MSNPIRIVAALGGNALEDKTLPPTAASQLEVTRRTAEYLADISCSGYELAIVHGNGPQVGRILLASETASEVTPAMPFDVCGAMSQGYIGYHLQQSLSTALASRGRHIPVVTVVTQIVVNADDPAFYNPTKPVGPFYSKKDADKLTQERHYTMIEDAGRGWRRVVASPFPQEILEIGTIKTLWDTTVTIACGGGGIPVFRNDDGTLTGAAAVIDKDLAAEKLARDMEADILLILTEVEKISLNYNTPEQIDLDTLNVKDAVHYMKEGHFAPGSMLPKVEAATRFAASRTGRRAIITSLYKAVDALEGRTGTVITDPVKGNAEEAFNITMPDSTASTDTSHDTVNEFYHKEGKNEETAHASGIYNSDSANHNHGSADMDNSGR